MTADSNTFEYVCRQAREAMLLQTAADALEWDERTGMPIEAGAYRAEQVAELRGLTHQLRVEAGYGERLRELVASLTDHDPHGDYAATVSGLLRDHERDVKLPTELVQATATATVLGQQAWDAARRADRYADFREPLRQVLQLKCEAGERLAEGTELDSYEALLQEYEPGARVATIESQFARLRQALVQQQERYDPAGAASRTACLRRSFPLAPQRVLSRSVAGQIGFDFRRGRLDETSHPFCTTLGPRDVRILTRYDERWLPTGLYGTLHEAGHGIYEQRLREAWFGLPPGIYASLGMHESQSRLWENQVGRSLPFWNWLYPQVRQQFSPLLDDVMPAEMHAAVNQVQPTLIRVEADEATYNLHILIRFDLERQLVAGQLTVDDLPHAWNERYRSDLGLVPPSDAQGVLQDVHWSAGLIGYFPTYTLGNLIAAQLYHAAAQQLGDLPASIGSGDFEPLRNWLEDNIHRHGRCYTAMELVNNATGSPLNASYLVDHLNAKLDAVDEAPSSP